MLQAINDRIKGWLGAAIVVLIGLPFAFWGIESYLRGGTEQYVAKVNDIEISDRELDFNVSQQRQRLREQLGGGELPFDDAFLKKQVLEQLINRKLVETGTYDAGYRISDKQLSASIVSLFNDNGEFDRVLFERALQNRGQSPQQFEFELRNDLRITQMRAGLMNTVIVTDEEIRRLIQLEDQQRDISLLRFITENYLASVTVSEDEILAAYESASSAYMLPEKVSIDYVELKNDQLASDIDVDEQQVQQMYDDYVADIARREKRQASHILLKAEPDAATARERLQGIREQLQGGADFAELAREHSQDPGSARQGGDLGWVEPGQMVKPFEDALFALEEGAVSDIVESEFGLHLIKLQAVKSETAASFADKREEFVQMLTQDALGNLFYDMSENLATIAYENPDSLGAVVDQMNLNLQQSELFTRQAGSGIASHDKVRNAAFSTAVLREGSNSDIIELSPDHVVVLRLHEHKPATLRPLDEVRTLITDNLRRQKAQKLALDAARAAKDRILAGETIEAVAGEGQSVERPGTVKRTDTAKVGQQVIELVFSMPRPEADKVSVREVSMFSGDVALVQLNEVITPDQIDQARIDSVKAQLRREVASEDINAALLSMRESAELYINPNLFEK